MTADPALAFGDVLNLLLESQATEDPNRPGTFITPNHTDVANAMNAKLGAGTITAEYVRRLRRNEIRNPSIQTGSLFAQFFGLPLDVFNASGSETSRKVVAEVQRFVAHRRRMFSDEPSTVAVLARTTRRLSPAAQQRVMDYAQKLQQLEEMEQETGASPGPTSD